MKWKWSALLATAAVVAAIAMRFGMGYALVAVVVPSVFLLGYWTGFMQGREAGRIDQMLQQWADDSGYRSR